MSGWGDPDGPNKRRAEHILQVANKRHHLGDVNPGREYVEPRVYQQPNYDPYDEEQQQQVRANGCQTVLPGRNLQLLLLAACCKLQTLTMCVMSGMEQPAGVLVLHHHHSRQ